MTRSISSSRMAGDCTADVASSTATSQRLAGALPATPRSRLQPKTGSLKGTTPAMMSTDKQAQQTSSSTGALRGRTSPAGGGGPQASPSSRPPQRSASTSNLGPTGRQLQLGGSTRVMSISAPQQGANPGGAAASSSQGGQTAPPGGLLLMQGRKALTPLAPPRPQLGLDIGSLCQVGAALDTRAQPLAASAECAAGSLADCWAV